MMLFTVIKQNVMIQLFKEMIIRWFFLNNLWFPYFFPVKHHERILIPGACSPSLIWATSFVRQTLITPFWILLLQMQ